MEVPIWSIDAFKNAYKDNIKTRSDIKRSKQMVKARAIANG